MPCRKPGTASAKPGLLTHLHRRASRRTHTKHASSAGVGEDTRARASSAGVGRTTRTKQTRFFERGADLSLRTQVVCFITCGGTPRRIGRSPARNSRVADARGRLEHSTTGEREADAKTTPTQDVWYEEGAFGREQISLITRVVADHLVGIGILRPGNYTESLFRPRSSAS